MWYGFCFILMTCPSLYGQETTYTQDKLATSTTATTQGNVPSIEQYVVGPFKVWHIVGFVGSGLGTILIAICCMIDLRIPRTKEEIEANYEKRQAAHKYIDKLGQMEFTGFQLKSQAAMQKEKERKKKDLEERKKQKKLNAETNKIQQRSQTMGSTGGTMMPGQPPTMMPGMMGYHPNMMMGNASGMFGSTNSLPMNAQMAANGASSAYLPGMMFGGMWPVGSMSNLQQKENTMQTSFSQKSTPASNLAAPDDPENKEPTSPSRSPSRSPSKSPSKFGLYVGKMMKDNKNGASDDKTDDKPSEEKKENDNQNEDENENKKSPMARKKMGEKITKKCMYVINMSLDSNYTVRL